MIGNKVANERISKYSQRKNSERVANKHDKEIPKEDIYHQNKHTKLFINWEWNSIAKEYQDITKDWKNSEQYNLETVKNENDKEVPKERYMSPEERKIIIDNLRTIMIV